MDMTERLVAELAALKARVANLERLEKSSFVAHAPMTLDANSVQVNSLTAQELGLQVQAHNFAWIGPESGAPAIPTFRLLLTDDIPIDSDTYNATAPAVVGTDADGGVRLDHAEFGNIMGAAEGEIGLSGLRLFGSGSLNLRMIHHTLANNGVAQLGHAATINGFVFVIARGEGPCAIFIVGGVMHDVYEVSDPNGIFSRTKGTASSVNIYWDAVNSRYEIENKRGGEASYSILLWLST